MLGVLYMLSYRYIICTQRGASRCNQECHLLAQVWVVLRPERNKNFDRELRYQNYHGHIPVAYRLYTKGQMRQTDYSDGIRWGKTFLSPYLYALAFMNHRQYTIKLENWLFFFKLRAQFKFCLEFSLCVMTKGFHHSLFL